ncbi:MAG: hypothetical protein HPZ86_01515 [Clostridia bacterium]|nr:hypothetical protein [Clostridia bacterium]
MQTEDLFYSITFFRPCKAENFVFSYRLRVKSYFTFWEGNFFSRFVRHAIPILQDSFSAALPFVPYSLLSITLPFLFFFLPALAHPLLSIAFDSLLPCRIHCSLFVRFHRHRPKRNLFIKRTAEKISAVGKNHPKIF